MRLEQDSDRVSSSRSCVVRPNARRVRQHEYPHFMGTVAQGRRDSCGNVDSGGGSEMERAEIAVPRREQRGCERQHERKTKLWKSRGGGFKTAGSAIRRRTERSDVVQACRQTAKTHGYSGEGEREYDIRYRCQSTGNALCVAPALPGIRRQSEELRCDESQSRSGREERRANFEWRRSACRQYLGCDGRPQGSRCGMG